jgi:hypothetical protein
MFQKGKYFPAISPVCRALSRVYGSPRHGNPRNPLDDLIYIVLSTRTRHSSFAWALGRNDPVVPH